MAAPGRFIYLVAEGLPPTVIDSQVVAVLRRLAQRGLVFDLYIYQLQAPRDDWNVAGHLKSIRQQLPGRVRLWPWPARRKRGRAHNGTADTAGPRARSGLRRTIRAGAQRAVLWAAGLALQALLLVRLAPSIFRGETVVVHARGAAVDLAVRLKRWYARLRVVADVRGDVVAESLYAAVRRGLSPESDAVRRELESVRNREARALAKADGVQCVSRSLRQRLETEAGVPAARIRVVPCLADEETFYYDTAARDRIRRELGLADRTAFVYSGSLLAWQAVAAILRLWTGLLARFHGLHLLLLTPEAEAARRLVEDSHLREEEQVSIRSARHDEVRGFLSAADVALLIREPHPLNRVASPTKFAEYVLTGLPVLASRGIGDLDEIITVNRLGSLLDNPDDPGEVEDKAAQAISMSCDERRADRARRAAPVVGLGPRLDEWTRYYADLARGAASDRTAAELDA